MLHVKMKRHLFVRHVADCKVQASGIISRGEQKHEGASVGEAHAGAPVGAVEYGERDRLGEGQGLFGCLVTARSGKGRTGLRFYGSDAGRTAERQFYCSHERGELQNVAVLLGVARIQGHCIELLGEVVIEKSRRDHHSHVPGKAVVFGRFLPVEHSVVG